MLQWIRNEVTGTTAPAMKVLHALATAPRKLTLAVMDLRA